MRRARLLAVLLLPVALAARDRGIPAVAPAGPPQSCVPLAGIADTEVRDDATIDFVMRNRTVYRNTLPAPCPQLGFERRFGYATSLSQICSTDIITVLPASPGSVGVSCGLGDFQPVTLVTRR